MPPVEDHPVHPSTKKGKDFRYGCWNRKPFMASYYAPNRKMGSSGYEPIFFYERVRVAHRMTVKCQYDMAETDPFCNSCQRIGERNK